MINHINMLYLLEQYQVQTEKIQKENITLHIKDNNSASEYLKTNLKATSKSSSRKGTRERN